MTATITPPPASAKQAVTKEEQPYLDPSKPRHTRRDLLGILVIWLVLWLVFRGKQTLELGFQDTNGFHDWLNTVRDWVQLHGPGNWFFGGVLGGISDGLNNLMAFVQKLVSIPAFPRPVPQIGWLGVVGVVVWIAQATAGIRAAILVALSFLFFGVVGLWPKSMDTLIVTVVAVVLCMLVGIPTGILMARKKSVSAVITPVLDVMQTMPPFCYLAPIALLFGIGNACAVVLTLIYALPPLVRITEHGIRSVSASTIEAARSMGLTRGQLLRQVQIPMARRTLVVGINQSMMAALSMATIAAFVAGPGLGADVNAGLQNQNVGAAAVPGLAIVVMAIMLDRTTTAISERSSATGQHVASVSGPGVLLTGVVIEKLPRWAAEDAGKGATRPRVTTAGKAALLGLLALPALVMVYLSRQSVSLATFPDVSGTPVLKYLDNANLVSFFNDLTDKVVNAIDTVTLAIKNDVSNWMLNPLQSLLGNSPWWLMALVLAGVAWTLGGRKALVATAVCEAIILGTGLWNDAMVTLTMTLLATLLVMLMAVVLGVVMGRNRRADVLIRPVLDAFQVIPPFVYLVPALALFGVGRFTAIVAALGYAVPIATKLVADGIRGVAGPTVEAAQSQGVTRWQMISRVQLPMSREALVLATNQGLLYVLSVVVIGGAVGGGSLGYLAIAGFSQGELFGKGLAAGIAITAIGVMLDRIARNAAARTGR